MSKKKYKRPPVMAQMCATCPFRPGSKHANLAPMLTESALSEASRICHSTGSNGLLGNTHKPDRLCRGARNVQIQFMHAMKVIDAPTDEAWEAKCKEMGLP